MPLPRRAVRSAEAFSLLERQYGLVLSVKIRVDPWSVLVSLRTAGACPDSERGNEFPFTIEQDVFLEGTLDAMSTLPSINNGFWVSRKMRLFLRSPYLFR